MQIKYNQLDPNIMGLFFFDNELIIVVNESVNNSQQVISDLIEKSRRQRSGIVKKQDIVDFATKKYTMSNNVA